MTHFLKSMHTDRLALAADVGDGVWRTQTDHGAKWQRVQNLAFLLAGAHIGRQAWILTSGVDTSEIRRAFAVLCAFRLDRGA